MEEKKGMTVEEFIKFMWGPPSKQEQAEPKVADDITVACCRECPFQEDIQNSWTHSCRLISYSTILNNSEILPNCPLRLKSINVSIDWSEINGK